MGDNNTPIEYDAKIAKKLEKKYKLHQTNIQIDNDRFVDLKAWVQRRYLIAALITDQSFL